MSDKTENLAAARMPNGQLARNVYEAYETGYQQARIDLAKRRPLSDEEIAELWGWEESGNTEMIRSFARVIEKAHGIQ